MISECGSNPLYQPLDAKYLLAPHHRDRLLEPRDRSEYFRYYIFSLKKCRLTATPSFLQTDYVVANLLVHNEDLYRSAHALLAINSPMRSLWVAVMSSLLRARSRSLLACRCATRRSALSPRLRFLAGTFFVSVILVLTYACVLQFLPLFTPESLVSRGGFGSSNSRQLTHLTRPSQA